MRTFLGINFLEEQVPDATTLMHFRHLLENAGLQKMIEREIVMLLDEQGLIMHGGTITDATIMQAASSTRTPSGVRLWAFREYYAPGYFFEDG
jgi:IS5 family transposase